MIFLVQFLAMMALKKSETSKWTTIDLEKFYVPYHRSRRPRTREIIKELANTFDLFSYTKVIFFSFENYTTKM